MKCDRIIFNEENNFNNNLIVIGDSHAGAYSRLINITANALNLNVKTKIIYGCSILKLTDTSSVDPVCIDSEVKTLEWLKSNVQPGDVVFFASLRLNRLSNQWGAHDADSVFRDFHSINQAKINSDALIDAEKWIRAVYDNGGSIIIDAPKPIFKTPIFRCMDWFNQKNPACSNGHEIDKNWLLAYRSPVLDSLDFLKSKYNIFIWDPFPILCPKDKCVQIEDDKPIFFDGDHLSGYGNLLLVDSFKAAINEILKR